MEASIEHILRSAPESKGDMGNDWPIAPGCQYDLVSIALSHVPVIPGDIYIYCSRVVER